MTTPSAPLDDTTPVTRLELERWALGELDAERAAALEAARAADPELDQRMQRVHDAVSAAAIGLPQLVLPADAPEAAPWWQRIFRPAPLLGMGLAAAAAVLLILPGSPDSGSPGPDAVVYRGKALDVQVTRVRLGEAEAQGGIVKARAGDRLQYDLTAPASGHLMVVNVQDDGALQVYLPSAPVSKGEVRTAAVELDDYAGTERIFFLFDGAPLDEAAVQGAVQKAWKEPLADLDALPGAADQQRSVLVVKEGP